MAMMERGLTQAEAREKIWLYDKDGLLVKVSLCDQNLHYVSVWLPVWLTVDILYYWRTEVLLYLCLCLWFQGRPQETDSNQEAFVHDSPGTVQSFLEAVNTIKPTAIIGEELLTFCICVCVFDPDQVNLGYSCAH